MSYPVYKLIHLASIMFLFTALGGVLYYVLNGGTREEASWRRGVAITHGLAMFGVLTGGFGMLARLSISFPFPSWIWIKIGVWLFLGLAIALSWRRPESTKLLWLALPLVGAVAGYSALYKPL